MRIVFMGTPDFSVPCLQALIDDGHDVCAVFTQPDKPKGRHGVLTPPPVKELALKYDIPVYQPKTLKTDEAKELFKSLNAELAIVVAYGKILPGEFIHAPKYGCINVHASLLPKLRGAAPIQKAIIDGEKETGVTIMQMAEGLDTGDMLLKESVEIGDMNYSRLHDRLAQIGSGLMLRALDLIGEGKIQPEKQDDSLSTYAHMISKADGKIDFSKSPEEIERLIRGFDPWPGAFCDCGDAMMKLWKAEPIDESTGEIEPGTVISADEKGLKIACGGRALMVTEIQMPGKKRVSVKEYLKGNKIEKGTILR